MKNKMREFFRRGLIACGFGPMVLAAIYLILQRQGTLESLTVDAVCRGIFSLSALAFIAGGMNVIYQIEQLPLMVAVLLHGIVLYCGYLAAYLLNGWLVWGSAPILVFSAVFVLGYIAIWGFIYSFNKRNTQKVNQILQKKRQGTEG